MQNRKCYGLIPAAGHSRRMGQQKLLMPWQDGNVIDSVLRAWTSSLVTDTTLVIREQDNRLAQACSDWAVDVLKLSDSTLDMKETVQQGISYIQDKWSPNEQLDGCLIAPADLPRLSTPLLNAVIESFNERKRIIVPVFGSKSGHPICIPWKLVGLVFELKPEQGLDQLIKDNDHYRLQLDPKLRPRDIDTPEDYQREFSELRKSPPTRH